MQWNRLESSLPFGANRCSIVRGTLCLHWNTQRPRRSSLAVAFLVQMPAPSSSPVDAPVKMPQQMQKWVSQPMPPLQFGRRAFHSLGALFCRLKMLLRPLPIVLTTLPSTPLHRTAVRETDCRGGLPALPCRPPYPCCPVVGSQAKTIAVGLCATFIAHSTPPTLASECAQCAMPAARAPCSSTPSCALTGSSVPSLFLYDGDHRKGKERLPQ